MWPKLRGWAAAVAITLCLLTALPLTQPAPWPDFGDVFTFRMSLIEHSGRWLGTTSTADYVPATVDAVPLRNGDLVYGFLVDQPLDRVNRASLPANTEVISEVLKPLHFRYTVQAPEKFLLRLFLFQFPGWQVRVDGELVEPELGLPEGFIVVPVPAGAHIVDVRFGQTLARQLAWGVSALSLLLAGLVAWRFGRRTAPAEDAGQLTPPDWTVLGAAGVVTAATLLILAPLGVLHLNSAGYAAEPAQTRRFDDFGGQIALIGTDLSAETAVPGDQITVTLYWQAQTTMAINFQSFVHLLRSDGSLAAQSDHLNPGEFPTRRWPLDKYVRDVHVLQLPPDLPPGTYPINAGLWVQAEGWRLPVLDASGNQIDDKTTLFTLTVVEE